MAEGVALGALFNTLWAWRNLSAYAKIGNLCPLRWEQRTLSRNSKEMTVGIWGYGHIAQHLVRMMRGLPFKEILVYCDHVNSEEMASHGATLAASLDEVFEKSDVIHLCAGANEQTFGTVDARLLAKIKDGATFINAGRAKLVDREALYAEAAKNRFDIILDVYYKEPPEAADSILTFPNVICTPHNSGNRDTAGYIPFLFEEIMRFYKGEPMLGEITRERRAVMTDERKATASLNLESKMAGAGARRPSRRPRDKSSASPTGENEGRDERLASPNTAPPR